MGNIDKQENVPAAVRNHVVFVLNVLRDHEFALSGVERARGNGHILALEIRDRTESIAKLQQQLNEFRDLAAKNGVDADVVIKDAGGEPDFSRFGGPAATGMKLQQQDETTDLYPAQRSFDHLKTIGRSVMQAMAHDGFQYDDPVELGDEVMARILSLDLPQKDSVFIGNYIFAQYGHGGGLRCSQKPFKALSERNRVEAQTSLCLAEYIDRIGGVGLIPAPDNLFDSLQITAELLPKDFQEASRLLTRPYLEIHQDDLAKLETLTQGHGDVVILGGVKATWGNCDGGKFALMPFAASLNQQRAEIQASRKITVDSKQQILITLLAQAAVPGGISQQEFSRPGGWLECAQKVLADHPVEMQVLRTLEALRMRNDELREALESVYNALDNASSVVDPGGDEQYAYQQQLCHGAAVLGISRDDIGSSPTM